MINKQLIQYVALDASEFLIKPFPLKQLYDKFNQPFPHVRDPNIEYELPQPFIQLSKKYILDDLEQFENPFSSNNKIIDLVVEFIQTHNMTDPQFYTKAGLRKTTFNNFINNKCAPSRNTLLCILLALELPCDSISMYMRMFGHFFPQQHTRDRVIEILHNECLSNRSGIVWSKYIEELNFALHQINDQLEEEANISGYTFKRMKLLPDILDCII